MKILSTLAVACGLMTVSFAYAAELNEDEAKAMLKKNDCFKCHAIDKKKDGKMYKEVAKEYKGKADAENKLFKHLTTGPKIKVDGKEEEHKIIKTSEADTRALIRWILSL